MCSLHKRVAYRLYNHQYHLGYYTYYFCIHNFYFLEFFRLNQDISKIAEQDKTYDKQCCIHTFLFL